MPGLITSAIARSADSRERKRSRRGAVIIVARPGQSDGLVHCRAFAPLFRRQSHLGIMEMIRNSQRAVRSLRALLGLHICDIRTRGNDHALHLRWRNLQKERRRDDGAVCTSGLWFEVFSQPVLVLHVRREGEPIDLSGAADIQKFNKPVVARLHYLRKNQGMGCS